MKAKTVTVSNLREIRDFLPPNDEPYNPLAQTVMGGIDIDNSTYGHDVLRWTVTYDGSNIIVKQADGTIKYTLAIPNVLTVSMSFSSSMKPVITWTTEAGAYLHFYNADAAAYVTRSYIGATSSRVGYNVENGATSVYFSYTKDTRLLCRKSSDEFNTEHFVSNVTQLLKKTGMNNTGVFQHLLFSGTSPDFTCIILIPITLSGPASQEAYVVMTSEPYTQDEGVSRTFTVFTSNVPSGTSLPWDTVGNGVDINAADFSDNVLSGSVTVTGTLESSSGTIIRTLVNDSLTENNEAYTIRLYGKPGEEVVVKATSHQIAINDTSITPPTPTYTVAPDHLTYSEGDALIVRAYTTHVNDLTHLFFTLNGTVLESDFLENKLNYEAVIFGNNAVISPTILSDAITDGVKTFIVELRTGSFTGPIVATTDVITINDTSTTPVPVPVYEVTHMVGYGGTVGYVNEGETATFEVSTTNVLEGTTLYWTTAGAVSATDFVTSVVSGEFTIGYGGTASFSVNIEADLLTEGDETFTVSLHTGSSVGPIVATTGAITINDTSTTPVAICTIAHMVGYGGTLNNVTEGETITFTVTTTNVPDGTGFTWGVNHTTTSDADFESTTGGGVIGYGGTVDYNIIVKPDAVFENQEYFTTYVDIPGVVGYGGHSAISENILLNNSGGSTYTIEILPSTGYGGRIDQVVEGATQTFVINTNAPDNTTLYWNTNGTVDASDFTNGVTSGTCNVSGGQAFISIEVAADAVTEGNETFGLVIHVGGPAGEVVASVAPEALSIVDA